MSAYWPLFAILLPIASTMQAGTERSQGPAMEFSASELGAGYVDIDATGTITPATPAALQVYLDDLNRRGLLDGQVSIAFDSGGGNLNAALELGRKIRAAGLSTTVQYGGRCLSSCSYAYFGGFSRYLPLDTDLPENDEQKLLGIHQFFSELDTLAFEEGDVSAKIQQTQSRQSQVTTRNLLTYLSEMGIDAAVLREASSAPPNEMRYPNIRMLKQSNVISFRGETPLQVLVDAGYPVAAIGRFGLTSFEQLTIGCVPGKQDKPFIALSASRGSTRSQGRLLTKVFYTWKFPKIRGEQLRPDGTDSIVAFRDGQNVERISKIVIENGVQKKILLPVSIDVRATSSIWLFTIYPDSDFMRRTLGAKYLSISVNGTIASGENDRYFYVEMEPLNAEMIEAVLRPCSPN